ncbi:hypothetical protein EV356DRAFT_536139 [Viridothelium virens]|uniref:Uncharacterized protein n=1 Tax=Viridothelium virens TaxID=1048519 RepID=A0A6A6GY90_VIRVR|nr:hypothetical protein EV356DRAFT_536139 [Viridothelium virens]
MDPVTTFSLASSIITVVDVSVKSMQKCREVYEEGSTLRNLDTEEIARHLYDENATLEKSMTKTPQSQLEGNREISELSAKVSETARHLLQELERVKTGSKRNVFATARKLAKTAFKSEYLKETQKKLENYREMLEFKILQRLDFRSLKLREDCRELDERVQRLIISLNDGHKSIEHIVTAENQLTQDSIIQFFKDRDEEREASRISSARLQKARKSLWFPEISSRQEDIAEAHPGTCEWLLHDDLRNFATETSLRETDHYCSQVDSGKRDTNTKLQQELSESRARFLDWLVDGKGIFWFTGKAGSGKSTLMKNLASHRKTEGYLRKWAGEADLLTPSPSFFCLGFGSSSLQKSLRGFLRSLLWQLTSRRPDLTSTVITQSGYESDVDNMENDFQAMNIWTEARLRTALKQFLSKKPQRLFFCIFIDGIDEIEDNANELKHFLEVLDDLKATPGVKLCAASRPEQRLRFVFGACPQTRLQDVNKKDILQATQDELLSSLSSMFPDQEKKIRNLISAIALKAEGVFLWASIVIKDIDTGAKNADSLDMLYARLDNLPNELDNLFRRMTESLDPLYRSEMETYLQILLVRGTEYRLTLMHFALLNPEVQIHLRNGDWKYFKSQEFIKLCQKTEIRIHVCCAGLVEVAKEVKGENIRYLRGLKMYNVSDEVATRIQALGIRTVQFIHRSVQEWILAHSDKILRGSNWILRGNLDLFSCVSGYLSLLPELNEEANCLLSPRDVGSLFIDVMTIASNIDALSGHSIVETVERAEQILQNVNQRTKLRLLRRCQGGYSFETFNMLFRSRVFFRDYLGLAAAFGLYNTVSSSIEFYGRDRVENLTQALINCLNGLDSLVMDGWYSIQVLTRIAMTITELLRRGADPMISIDILHDSVWTFEMSPWVCFIRIISSDCFAEELGEADDILGRAADPEIFIKALESATRAFVTAGADCEGQSFLYAIIVKVPDDAVVREPFIMFQESILAYLKRTIGLVELHNAGKPFNHLNTTYLSRICSCLEERNVSYPGKWHPTSKLPFRINSDGPPKLAFGPREASSQLLFMDRGRFGREVINGFVRRLSTSMDISFPPIEMHHDMMERLKDSISISTCELTSLGAIQTSWNSPAGVYFVWPKAQVAGSVELPNGLTNFTALIKYHAGINKDALSTPQSLRKLYNSDLLSEGEDPIILSE